MSEYVHITIDKCITYTTHAHTHTLTCVYCICTHTMLYTQTSHPHIIMARFPASYFIHIPRYNVCIWHWIHANVWAMYYARYLGLGMRYGAGICTIVISMNGAFKWCPFCFRLNFDPKSWKTTFGWVHFSAKIWPTLKSTLKFKTSFERSFHADHNGTIPSFISHSHTKIQCDSPWIMITWSIGIRPNVSAMLSALTGLAT